MASAEPAQNQWDTSSWAEVKDKAEVVRERCVRGGGNGGSIPAGRAGRLRILLLGPDSSFLKDFARIHPGLMRARPGASTSNSFIQRVAAGFMMPTTDAGNAATVCHSNADCEQGSSCPVNENGGGGGGGGGGDGQDVDEETIYGRALGLAVAICAVMMKANGFGP
ncbi:MAG: hypothetical protein M1836_000676 [Candelina mexicana]|nr:MAG: hypothetical protein M1836_000676 [Candelina mexicana]